MIIFTLTMEVSVTEQTTLGKEELHLAVVQPAVTRRKGLKIQVEEKTDTRRKNSDKCFELRMKRGEGADGGVVV